MNCLQQTASDSEFRTYLKPLRKAAIRMAASGGGRPMLSRKTESKGSDLVSAINAAEGYFDRLSDNAEYTDVVEKILEIREWITSNYEM